MGVVISIDFYWYENVSQRLGWDWMYKGKDIWFNSNGRTDTMTTQKGLVTSNYRTKHWKAHRRLCPENHAYAYTRLWSCCVGNTILLMNTNPNFKTIFTSRVFRKSITFPARHEKKATKTQSVASPMGSSENTSLRDPLRTTFCRRKPSKNWPSQSGAECPSTSTSRWSTRQVWKHTDCEWSCRWVGKMQLVKGWTMVNICQHSEVEPKQLAYETARSTSSGATVARAFMVTFDPLSRLWVHQTIGLNIWWHVPEIDLKTIWKTYFWKHLETIWWFPEIGVPLNHPFQWDFPLYTLYFGRPPFMEPPISVKLLQFVDWAVVQWVCPSLFWAQRWNRWLRSEWKQKGGTCRDHEI